MIDFIFKSIYYSGMLIFGLLLWKLLFIILDFIMILIAEIVYQIKNRRIKNDY